MPSLDHCHDQIVRALQNDGWYVPKQAFEAVYDATIRRVIRDFRVKLMIVDTEQEVIAQWIE
jgi:hypothetical protein